ncbi:hypothetical protein TNCV_2800961 [Trichonephila clavipes]|nr:hypothetical protein TNCV_2800961 [Trichonephila clavipes]
MSGTLIVTGEHKLSYRLKLHRCIEGGRRFSILALHGLTFYYSDYPQVVAAEIYMIRKSHPSLKVQALSISVIFHNAPFNAAFTGIASNTNSAIMVLQIKATFRRKDNLLPISFSCSMFMSPL